jgi:steroid 5-alpha reductase family enzyme
MSDSAYGTCAWAVLVSMLALWGANIHINDPTFIDVFWGIGFAMQAFLCIPIAQYSFHSMLLFVILSVWALRLSRYLYRRWCTMGPDRRYVKLLRRLGGNPVFTSFFAIFLMQGIIMWVVGLPIQYAASTRARLSFRKLIGAIIAMLGLLTESLADWQLAKFRTQGGQGKVMNQGLWRYSRHPNHFGNCVLWWGIYLFTAPRMLSWIIISPVLMTALLIGVSGVPTVEAAMRRRPGYRRYVKATSRFIPWFPKQLPDSEDEDDQGSDSRNRDEDRSGGQQQQDRDQDRQGRERRGRGDEDGGSKDGRQQKDDDEARGGSTRERGTRDAGSRRSEATDRDQGRDRDDSGRHDEDEGRSRRNHRSGRQEADVPDASRARGEGSQSRQVRGERGSERGERQRERDRGPERGRDGDTERDSDRTRPHTRPRTRDEEEEDESSQRRNRSSAAQNEGRKADGSQRQSSREDDRENSTSEFTSSELSSEGRSPSPPRTRSQRDKGARDERTSDREEPRRQVKDDTSSKRGGDRQDRERTQGNERKHRGGGGGGGGGDDVEQRSLAGRKRGGERDSSHTEGSPASETREWHRVEDEDHGSQAQSQSRTAMGQ